jgi:hypothetical protein
MEGEVNLRDRLLLADRSDRIIDLYPAGSAIRQHGLVLSIHDQAGVGHTSRALVAGVQRTAKLQSERPLDGFQVEERDGS